MRSGFRLGRVLGIDIEIDWSWLFIFGLITWSLSLQFYRVHPNWGAVMPFVIALMSSTFFFASVLAHELAHSLAAKARGLQVERIRLFMFGGVSNIEREPRTPKDEAIITIVGPLTSIAIAFILGGLAGIMIPPDIAGTEDATMRAAALQPVPTMLAWLASANLAVGIFNLIPGFPLDGGRILRSILWAIMKDVRRATVWATTVTHVFAWLLIALGLSMAFGAYIPFFGGGIGSGIWIALIGWFLNTAATQSRARVYVEEALGGTTVANLMRPIGRVVLPTFTVGDLVRDGFMRSDVRAFPVMDEERFLGLVTLEDVRKVRHDHWDQTTVREIMTPFEKLATVRPTTPATDALALMNARDVNQLPVVDDQNRLVGMVWRSDFLRWLELRAPEPAYGQ